MKTLFCTLALGAAGVLSACAHDQTPSATPTDPPASATNARSTGTKTDETRVYIYANVPCLVADAGSSATALSGPVQSGSTPMIEQSAEATTDAGVRLTDDQILQVTRTANSAEVAQAQLAHRKSRDARVQRLAAVTIRDQEEEDTQGAAIAKKVSLRPDESPQSIEIESQTGGTMRNLKVQTGDDFNKAYVDAQVRQNRTVLGLIEGKLLPESTAPDLRTYLQRMKSSTEDHLDNALALREQLER
jgi:putative membrane protein